MEELYSSEDVHMFGARLRREADKADLFGAFDQLLGLLDYDAIDLAFAARQVLVDVVCAGLSPKEQLLKCSEALVWYSQGSGGVGFLVDMAVFALSHSNVSRSRAEASNMLLSAGKAVFALGDSSGEVMQELDALVRFVVELDIDLGTDAVLSLIELRPGEAVRWTELLARANRRLLQIGAHDGRVVFLLEAAVRCNVGSSLLRPCVLTPAHSLFLASPVIRATITELCNSAEDVAVLGRARVAMSLAEMLLERCKSSVFSQFELADYHRWVKDFVQALIDFSVRSPVQGERLKGWKLIETCFERMSVVSRAEAFAFLIEQCPFATVVCLVIGKVKDELRSNGGVWWPLCEPRLFNAIFRIPKDASEMSSKHDVIVAGLNLVLFLTIRAKRDAVITHEMLLRVRQEYVQPLEKMVAHRVMQGNMPVDLEQQNKLMKTVSDHQWTEESLKAEQQKTLVADELCMSIIRRIESYR
jgi:hypothetical protein